jgi:hypothetical protein
MDERWAEYLTGAMREIADSIGIDGAFALWAGCKYQQVWIAEDWRKNEKLIELLGDTRAEKISADFASEFIYVPGEEIENILLAERILGFDREGVSTVQIAKRMAISRTRVYLLRKRFVGCNEWLAEAEALRSRRKKILWLAERKRLDYSVTTGQSVAP